MEPAPVTAPPPIGSPPEVDGRERPPGVWWAWVQLHGGTGLTTLSQALPGGADFLATPSDRHWPGLPAVGVCRSHSDGLDAAESWARWTAAHRVPVLGLIVVADAPGRLPRPLAALLRSLRARYPKLWRAPWVEAWRRGERPTPANTPPVYRRLLWDLHDRAGVPGAR